VLGIFKIQTLSHPLQFSINFILLTETERLTVWEIKAIKFSKPAQSRVRQSGVGRHRAYGPARQGIYSPIIGIKSGVWGLHTV
jgi:hypothetical protein